MFLEEFLKSSPKADLQSYHLYWLPESGRESAKDKLASVLFKCMSNQDAVRERFEGLGGSHRAFLISLLGREGYQGTLPEVRSGRHGGQIADYEVETILRSLVNGGFVYKDRNSRGGGTGDRFTIPEELGNALRRTVSIEDRGPMEMLSLKSASADEAPATRPMSRIKKISDKGLRKVALKAAEENHGILPHSEVAAWQNGDSVALENGDSASDQGLFPQSWRALLEESGLGTVGVLNLNDYGLKFEEEAVVLYQENLHEAFLKNSRKLVEANEAEVFVGSDFTIDLERLLDLLRSDKLEVTREGRLYKKIEDRISSSLMATRYQDVFDGKVVQHLLDTARRLRFFEVEDHQLVPTPLRRSGWQESTLREKLQALFELFVSDHQDGHWSFHQKSLRKIFLAQLQETSPGSWLSLPAFLSAVVARFLATLEDEGVREEYQARCDDEQHSKRRGIVDPVKVSLAKLYHDLSYWVVHRMALMGLVDVGLKGGSIQALRLSDLGQRFFGLKPWEEGDSLGRPALINPDFEVLVFPEMPLEDEANLVLSRFADRLGSDRVKRYRLTRESVKRGICSGFTAEQLLDSLKSYSRNEMPHNVEFSLKEWAQGVELLRRERATLFRGESLEAVDRLAGIFEQQGIAFERLNETVVAVRGAKNEKVAKGLGEELHLQGLYIE